MSFGAHPDDIELGCGGTEAKLIDKGYKIVHVYATSGEAGRQTISKEKLGKIREEEAKQAAKVLGVGGVEFLRYPDGLTDFIRKMKIDVINLIRKEKPNIIFVHETKENFPDHKIISDLVLSGAAGPGYQEAKGEPWTVETILGYEVWHPITNYQLVEYITNTIQKKMGALVCYKSQVETTKYDKAFEGLARYRGVMTWGKYAEVFEVIKTSKLI